MAQNKLSLVNQFYGLMIHKVLLPDYMDSASPEAKKQELEAIIERYMSRLDRVIDNTRREPFHVMMGDTEELIEEVERLGGVNSRTLRPW